MSSKKRIITSALAVALGALSLFPSNADDSMIKIKTLTYDSITTRRAVFDFPTDGEYRKIIMKYSLKCDPRTTHDRFDCGEWDLSSYSYIYHNTGRDSVYSLKTPRYMLGKSTDKELKYTPISEASKYQNTYKELSLSGEITSASETEEVLIVDGDLTQNLVIGNKPFKMQYVFSNKDLKELKVNGKKFAKLSLNFLKAGKIKNLKISALQKIANTHEVANEPATLVYSNDYTAKDAGWNEIILSQAFETRKNGYGLVLNISGDGFDTEDNGFVQGTKDQFTAMGNAKYAEFDGENDYVQINSDNILKNTDEFTVEALVKMNKQKSWSKIMGVGDRTHFEVGDNGDLYFFMRNDANNFAKINNALHEGVWTHIAAVFDGKGKDNAERLKLYINGKPANPSYKGQIPSHPTNTKKQFSISSTEWGSACFNGAISNVRVWKTALTAEEISEYHNHTFLSSNPEHNNEDLLLNFNMQEVDETKFQLIDGFHKDINGQMYGFPTIKKQQAEALSLASAKPAALKLTFGNFDVKEVKAETERKEDAKHYSLIEYEVKDDKLNVKSMTPVLVGKYYTYDANGAVVSANDIPATVTLNNDTLSHKSEPTPVIENYEIARFITPYGIGLDLGPDGFTWKYDVTDYAHLLKGKVDLSAGDQLELIDVTFEMYKGVPPRKVVNLRQLWGGYGQHQYGDLSDDTKLKEIELDKTAGAVTAKVKTRVTGHGHYGNVDNQYPHCCEWKDNTHYIFLNDDEYKWKIWQTNDCAQNPVFPQGGTWPGAREGWCPGDVVNEHDFEFTNYKDAKSAIIDYDISKVPSDQQGMRRGFYEMCFNLVEYGEQTHEVDAEVYDVFAPSTDGMYSRMNPICSNPKVVIRNNGKTDLTSLKLTSQVSGGTPTVYDWTGKLAPNMRDTVELPIQSFNFWLGDGTNKYTVTASNPNGQEDQYKVNDAMTTEFKMPDIVEKGSYFNLIAPNIYAYNISFVLRDITGKEIFNYPKFNDSQNIKEVLDLPEGCYTMEVKSSENIGMYYWAVNNYGKNSELKLYDSKGNLLKAFQTNFGHSLTYSFHIGEVSIVQDAQSENLVSLYPSPAQSEITLLIEEDFGDAELQLYNSVGEFLRSFKAEAKIPMVIDITQLTAGNYFFKINSDKYSITKNFIKK